MRARCPRERDAHTTVPHFNPDKLLVLNRYHLQKLELSTEGYAAISYGKLLCVYVFIPPGATYRGLRFLGSELLVIIKGQNYY